MPRKTRRTSAYWEGVKDALQLVHNFLDYHEDHPEESADIRSFILKSIKKAHGESTPRLKAELEISFKKEGAEKEKGSETKLEKPQEEKVVKEEKAEEPSKKEEEKLPYKPIVGPEPPPLDPEPTPTEPAKTSEPKDPAEPDKVLEPEKPGKTEMEPEAAAEPTTEPKPETPTEVEEKELPSEPKPFTIKIEKPPGLELDAKSEEPSKPSEPESPKPVPELGKLLGLDFRRDSDVKKLEKEEKKTEEEKSDPEPFI